MKNKNANNGGSLSFRFVEQVINRLESRRLLKGVAEVTETHFFTEGEFQLESEVNVKCKGNEPIVFVCNTPFAQPCDSPVIYFPCPGTGSYACTGGNYTCQQHSSGTKSFDCAHFICMTNFSCNVQSLFQCSSAAAYVCRDEFACASHDVGFVCPRKHDCDNSPRGSFECRTNTTPGGGKFECGHPGADLDSFSCTKKISDTGIGGFQCSSTRDAFNCEETTDFRCSGSGNAGNVADGFRCVTSPSPAQGAFNCKEHFNCYPSNKVSCSGGGGATNNFNCGTANTSFSRCANNNNKECDPSANYKCFQNNTCKSPANGGNFICSAYSDPTGGDGA